jgi:hypothetical protein
MTGVLALLSAAALGTLPALPARGLARETRAGVQLQTLAGRPLATVAGLDLAPDKVRAHRLVMRDRRGRLFVLDREARIVRGISEPSAIRRGCRQTDTHLFVCGRTIRHGSRVVARAPNGSPSGSWVWAEFAPRGDAILAQWEAECETPVAYLALGGRLRPYGRESVALGWLPTGEALIHFPSGPCGGSIHTRGVYAVPRSGEPRLLLRTPRFAQYLMWGG